MSEKKKKPDFIIIPADAEPDLVFDHTTENNGVFFYRETEEAGPAAHILKIVSHPNDDILSGISEISEAMRPFGTNFPFYAIRNLSIETMIDLLSANNFVVEVAQPRKLRQG